MTVLSLPVGGYAPRESSHGAGLAAFRQAVIESSNGMVEVPVTWNILDQGRPATDLFELVEAGEMFLCYFSTSYQGTRVPALNVIEVPYLFPDLAAAHAALDGPLGERLQAAVHQATGFELLGFWDNGFRHLSNRLRPVRAPSDCAGMTVRLQPNPYHEAMIEAWGATPVAVELSEGIRLITAGSVDAQENPLANAVAYGVDRVHRFFSMTGHLYGARGLFVNQARLASLPPDVRSLVEEAARKAVEHQRRIAGETELRLRQELEGGGLHFVDLAPEEKDAFGRASIPAIRLAGQMLPPELLVLAGARS